MIHHLEFFLNTDSDSEHWQNKKIHKTGKLDKNVERAVVTSWRSSHNLATSAFDKTLGIYFTTTLVLCILTFIY